MDSITHSLFKALAAANAQQSSITPAPPGGLRPFAERPDTHMGYAGAAGTDLFITLAASPELLALQLEFVAAGFTPPAGMCLNGADVILAPGEVQLFVSTDNAEATWMATLARSDPQHRHDRRAAWSEQVL